MLSRGDSLASDRGRADSNVTELCATPLHHIIMATHHIIIVALSQTGVNAMLSIRKKRVSHTGIGVRSDPTRGGTKVPLEQLIPYSQSSTINMATRSRQTTA